MTREFATEKPIFVVGCERSGTTLLRAMLDNHPNVAIPHEAEKYSRMFSDGTNIWNAEWKTNEIADLVRTFLGYEKVQHWKLSIEEVLINMDGRSTYRFKDILDLIYRSYAGRNGKKRWGDKTPSNTFEMPFLIESFPESQFIHIVRDGRDVYLSWKKAHWVNYNVEQAASQWKAWTFAAHRYRHRLGKKRYLLIRFEDLVGRTLETLEKVTTFLQEPFAEEMLSYYKRTDYVPERGQFYHKLLSQQPDKERIFSWKKNMLPSEKERFDLFAGKELIQYGYETDPSIRKFSKPGYLLAWSKRKFMEMTGYGS